MRGYSGNSAFGGLDARKAAQEGTIHDMRGLTSAFLPAAATREKRRYISDRYQNLQGIYFGDRVFYCADNQFFDDGTPVTTVTEGEKSMVVLGDYLYIYPDKIKYKTRTKGLTKLDDATVSVTHGGSGNTVPTSSMYFVKRQENPDTGVTEYNNTIFVDENNSDKIKFKVGDIVWILDEDEGIVFTGKLLYKKKDQHLNLLLIFADGAFNDIWGSDIHDTHMIPFTIKYAIPPNFKFVFSANNRLWGARNRELFASALGQGDVWMDYDTLTTSSWTAETEVGDTITGGVSFSGTPVFFAENAIYKVFGDNAKNFEYAKSVFPGVMEGEQKSIVEAGGYLYYLSRVGVCAYTGGIPEIISKPLGEGVIRNGVGGSDGVYYYLSADVGNSHALYYFDAKNRCWIKDSTEDAAYIGLNGKNLLCINKNGVCFTLQKTWDDVGTEEKEVEFFLEMKEYYDGSPNRKHANRILLRMETEGYVDGAVLVSYDDEEWVAVGDIKSTYGKILTFVYPLGNHRYDNMRIKIEGKTDGRVLIYSLIRDTKQVGERPGGDRNVYV